VPASLRCCCYVRAFGWFRSAFLDLLRRLSKRGARETNYLAISTGTARVHSLKFWSSRDGGFSQGSSGSSHPFRNTFRRKHRLRNLAFASLRWCGCEKIHLREYRPTSPARGTRRVFVCRGTKPWINNQPFTSEDVDAYGGNAQMLKLLRKLEIDTSINVSVDVPATPDEEIVNTGILIIRPLNAAPDEFLGINIIHAPLGLSPREIHEKQCEIKLDGIPISVLHPIQCIESKAINLLRLDQSQRQDKKHLELSLGNFGRFLLDPRFKTTPGDQSKLIKRLVDLAYSTEGQNLLTDHKVEKPAIPRHREHFSFLHP
jgi:hypothetical protein